MDTAAEIEALSSSPGRVAGTDAERRAALLLRGRLEAMGRNAEVQPLLVRPRFAAAHAIHAALAVVGSVLAIDRPVVGTALVALATALTFLDIAGIMQVVRRLTGTRASQNVESREGGEKPGVLVLVAAYDHGRDGRGLALATRILRNPWLALLAAMGVILVCCALRLAGLEGTVLTAVQFVPTLLLVVLIAALVDYELSRPAAEPARDAAVAAALRLSEDLGGQLEHFDLWVVFTGAQRPFALGMVGWLKRRRKELDSENAAVISLGPVEPGPVRYTRREGPLVPLRVHSQLARLAGEIAEDEGDMGPGRTLPYASREPSDAARAIARGLPAITVSCSGREQQRTEGVESVERCRRFCRELASRLDAEVGPHLEERAEHPSGVSPPKSG